MVSICLEYVFERANKIYIYCSYEEGLISSDFFYNINGKIVERHKLNDAINDVENIENFSYDTSVDRQKAVVKIINDNIKEMIKLCNKYNREMPTEIKLIYDVQGNKLTANYQYDLVHTNNPNQTAKSIARSWFEEIKNNN
ncbi:immunity protein YezG family protein [Gracilibacillus saliphilus]|uniref:immunity protein YezG family protein n=1 Tax=Gracilibacillus saliphilus TaxID=543890 RepID=UPI0013D8D8C4|nr:immunity protein YezG family protein [Gracilibacillus saliphilus]